MYFLPVQLSQDGCVRACICTHASETHARCLWKHVWGTRSAGRWVHKESPDGAHGLAGGHWAICPTRFMGGPLVGVCKVVSRIRGSFLSPPLLFSLPIFLQILQLCCVLGGAWEQWVSGSTLRGWEARWPLCRHCPLAEGLPLGMELSGFGEWVTQGKWNCASYPLRCVYSQIFLLQRGSGTSLLDPQALRTGSPLWVVVEISVSTGRQGCRLLPSHLADITPSDTTQSIKCETHPVTSGSTQLGREVASFHRTSESTESAPKIHKLFICSWILRLLLYRCLCFHILQRWIIYVRFS